MSEIENFSPSKYLEKHNVLLYIEDAISELLKYKDENNKVIHAKFLADYFRSVHQGIHVLFREFEFISSTPLNRSCFIKSVWMSFRHIVNHGGAELLSVKEYHSLLGLLCHDFPLDMVQRTARIVLMDDALDCLMSFADFLYAFQIQFYYEGYLNACKEIYDHQKEGTTTVFVPSQENWQDKKSSTTTISETEYEGVNSQLFFEAMEKSIVKLSANIPRPSLEHVHSELFKASHSTYYGLLIALSKNEDINWEIGVLPHRANILDGTDAQIILSSD